MKSDIKCDLCKAVHESLYLNDKKYYNVPLYQSDYFIILPSIGPLTLGHVLVTSKLHYLNLSSSPIKLINDYKILFDKIKSRYSLYGNNLLEVENGPNSNLSAGACIAHSHIHWIPQMGQFDDILEGKLDLIGKIKNLENIKQISNPYILIRGNSGIYHIYDAEKAESQFVRKIISQLSGKDDWDWAVFPKSDIIHDTIKIWRIIKSGQ